MKRLSYQDIIHWKGASDRKPLIIQGARQVGKTYLISKVAAEAYPDSIYCNFEEDPAIARLFQAQLSADFIVEQLSLYRNKKIEPEKTLIIFDEIQKCPQALTSLKYFHEQRNDYHVIAAGSLLGVSIGQDSAFPVGKVNFLHLYPLNFIEYLHAMDQSQLADYLQNKTDFLPFTDPIHEKFMAHFRLFLFLGGMPEVLAHYREYSDIEKAIQIQKDIHLSYSNDFSKYALPAESLKISQIWQAIPAQLAKDNKKFRFGDIHPNARYARYEMATEWLRKAGLIYLANETGSPKVPLETYAAQNQFKIYYLDTGLLGIRLNLQPQHVTQPDSLYTEFKGALIENYCAKEIKPIFGDQLHYWKSSSQAEVDFLVECRGKIYPIEVKSGMSQHKQSLQSYQAKYHPELAVRLSPRNFVQQEKFVNIPLYAACVLKNFLA